MADKALAYWTDAILDASPDQAADIAIGQITGVAGNPYGQHVSIEGSVTVTPGADTTQVELFVALNTIAGTTIGATGIPFPAVEATPQTCSFVVSGQIPVGVATLLIGFRQVDASADATIDALTAVAFVGS